MRFAREGARVCALDADPRLLDAALGELCATGAGAIGVHADVTSEAEVAAAVARAVEAWGGLDVVVAGAGTQLSADAPVDALDAEAWRATLDLNLTGVFHTCKHGIRALRGSGGGSVVCVGSGAASGLGVGNDAYCASKGGVHALARTMANDYADEGIRVNTVVPGLTDTPLVRGLMGDGVERHARMAVPLARAARAEEIAAAILFLASDEASYVTGIELVVDGGAANRALLPRREQAV